MFDACIKNICRLIPSFGATATQHFLTYRESGIILHLLERNHTERFRFLLERHLPTWQQTRELLNQIPLGHERR